MWDTQLPNSNIRLGHAVSRLNEANVAETCTKSYSFAMKNESFHCVPCNVYKYMLLQIPMTSSILKTEFVCMVVA